MAQPSRSALRPSQDPHRVRGRLGRRRYENQDLGFPYIVEPELQVPIRAELLFPACEVDGSVRLQVLLLEFLAKVGMVLSPGPCEGLYLVTF
jgi:hypothetical protein